MTTLSTHVLDTMHGRPAEGMAIILVGPDGSKLAEVRTNKDGRCPDMASGELPPGLYSLIFFVDQYFEALGVELPNPPFLGGVSVGFGMAEGGGHYHVPLLVSPYGYSTYRGS